MAYVQDRIIHDADSHRVGAGPPADLRYPAPLRVA